MPSARQQKEPPAGRLAERGLVMFLAKRRRKKGEAEEEDDEERLEPRAPRDEDERDYMSTVARMAMR